MHEKSHAKGSQYHGSANPQSTAGPPTALRNYCVGVSFRGTNAQVFVRAHSEHRARKITYMAYGKPFIRYATERD